MHFNEMKRENSIQILLIAKMTFSLDSFMLKDLRIFRIKWIEL